MFYRLLSLGLDLISAAVILVPVVLAADCIRRRGWPNLRTWFLVLFALYLAAVCSLVGLPRLGNFHPDVSLNLIPARSLFEDSSAWKEMALNVLLFVPLGMFLPLLWRSFHRPRQTVLAGACLSLAIELLQLLNFRTTDVDDLICNTIGSFVGYLTLYYVNRWTGGRAAACQERCGVRGFASVTVLVFLVTALAAPLISGPLWDLILN